MRRTIAWLTFAALWASPASVWARTRRPPFEPADLDLEDPGHFAVSLQTGFVRDGAGYHLHMPDFELDFGLTESLELGVDGTFALSWDPAAGEGGPPVAVPTPDNLWISLTSELLDVRDEDGSHSWALGVQHGPRIPVQAGTQGVGYEGLLLGARKIPRATFVVQLGAFVDPQQAPAPAWSTGFNAGLDVTTTLDAAERWEFAAEVFTTTYVEGPTVDVGASAGFSFSPNDRVEISVMGLGGWIGGAPGYGVFLGVTPHGRFPRPGTRGSPVPPLARAASRQP